MSPDSPFPTNISPSVTSSGWHSFANPVKRGGTAGRIYYHGVWHLDLAGAGHAKPGQSHTAVNLRQKVFSSVENSALNSNTRGPPSRFQNPLHLLWDRRTGNKSLYLSRLAGSHPSAYLQ